MNTQDLIQKTNLKLFFLNKAKWNIY